MPISARRDALGNTVAAHPARERGRGASRNPPGPQLPAMAPSTELVALQSKMQSAPVSNFSAATAPIQRQIDIRLKTRWYRHEGNSHSSKVNVLLNQYNAIAPVPINADRRIAKLAEIEDALGLVNPSKAQVADQIREAIQNERAAIEEDALILNPVGPSSNSPLNAVQDEPEQVEEDAEPSAVQIDAEASDVELEEEEEEDEEDEDDDDVPSNDNPIIMQRLLAFSDAQIETLCERTTVKGPLMGILKGAFEANWFKAKDCLVFGKWPNHGAPQFSPEKALKLMTALTVLRGNVHKMLMPLAQTRVFREIAEKSLLLKKARPLFAMHLAEQGANVAPEDQIQYKGSVGADTVTSDVDVSTGGKNSELGVSAYNKTFRETLAVEFDPGTVFDLNVYAMDFVHGYTPQVDQGRLGINVNAEHPSVPIDQEKAAKRDQEQEIWSLVHIARYMPDEDEWNAFVDQSLPPKEGTEREKAERTRLEEMFEKARARAASLEDRVTSMMAHLEDNDEGLGDVLSGESSWSGADARLYGRDALRMRAANRLYEDKLLQVKELRATIAKLKGQPEKAEQLSEATANLSREISMAQLYGNEVYGSGGATVHAVFGMQTKRKLEKDKDKNRDLLPVDVHLTPEQWYETFNDNLGDVLKDFLHFGTQHGSHDPDYWYAAFKMGKYVDRMLDAIPHLAEARFISALDARSISGSDEVKILGDLARWHLHLKGGIAATDPQQLKNDPYFGQMNAARVGVLKQAALSLGAKVRRMVALNRSHAT